MRLDVKTTAEEFFRFDKTRMRSAMREIGKEVTQDAKKRAISGGNFPKKNSGALSKAINYKVGSRGGYVKILQKTPIGAKAFYPAFLIYRKDIKKDSWVSAAYEANKAKAQSKLAQALAKIR